MYKRTKIEAEVHPRFLCLEEFMNYTGLGRGSAMKLGKEIGCVMKVGNIDWDLLGRTIGTGINTIVNTLDLFYTGIDWKNLGSKFAEGVNGVVYEVDWAKLGQFIGHKLLALPTVIVGFIENLDWSALSKAASTLMAVLGDQKSGNNIEAPESLIRRIVREESGNGKGSTYNVTAQVNRRTLFDLVLEEGKVRRTVTGRNPFETV